MVCRLLPLTGLLLISSVICFTPPLSANTERTALSVATDTPQTDMSEILYNPTERDAHYGTAASSEINMAQYMMDLHDEKATFNFCGGMMFQLVLSKKLRTHLQTIGAGDANQPKLFDKSHGSMSRIPNYDQSASADNINVFHGREVRKVKDAAGGMGFAMHLSMVDEQSPDPESWTMPELIDYDGWGHDAGRNWRTADDLAREGNVEYGNVFGKEAYGLHHRCFWHLDGQNRVWLSAEDGCEGYAAPSKPKWNALMDKFKF